MEFYQITDYRDFVRSYFKRRARNGHGEIAKAAEAIRVQPAFISQVLSGKKEFSMEQSYAIAEYLNLTPEERTYFLLIVQRDRAGTKDYKKHLDLEINKFREAYLKISNRIDVHRNLSDEDKAIFYSSWLYMAVWLSTSIKGTNGSTVEDICKKLRLGRKRALLILDFLVAKDLCIYENGFYRMGSQHVHIPNDSPFVVRHHMNWRTKALQRHDQVSEEEIAFSCPVSISKKDFLRLRERVLACIQESIEIAKLSEAEDLAFLNIDWLWVEEPTQT